MISLIESVHGDGRFVDEALALHVDRHALRRADQPIGNVVVLGRELRGDDRRRNEVRHRVHADGAGRRTVFDGRLNHLAVVGGHAEELVRLTDVLLLHFVAASEAARAEDDRLGVDGHARAVRLDRAHADCLAILHNQLGCFRFQQVLTAHLGVAVIRLGEEALRELLLTDIGGENRPLAADEADRRGELEAIALQPVAGLAAFIDDLGNQLRLRALRAVHRRVVRPRRIESIRIHQLLTSCLGVNAINRVFPIHNFARDLTGRVDVRRAGSRYTRAAPLASLVDGQHVRAGFRRCQRRRRARRTHADDHDINIIFFCSVDFRNRLVHSRHIHARALQRIDDRRSDAIGARRRAADGVYRKALILHHAWNPLFLHRGDHAHRFAIVAHSHIGNFSILDFDRDMHLLRQVEAAAFALIRAVHQRRRRLFFARRLTQAVCQRVLHGRRRNRRV